MKFKKKVLSLLVLCFVYSLTYSQDIMANLTASQADLLLQDLKIVTHDSAKIGLLLKLSQYHILKSGEDKADLDIANKYISQAENLNSTNKYLDLQGQIYFVRSLLYKENCNKKGGLKLLKKAISFILKDKKHRNIGDAYIELSRYYEYFIQEQLDKKIKAVELAVSAYKSEGSILKLAYSLELLADLYTNNGDNVKAIVLLKASLANYQAVHYRKLQGVYIIFSTAYSQCSDYKQAAKYGLMALKTAENLQDTSMLRCQINNIVGVILIKMKEYKKSIEYFKNALKIAERHNDHNNILLVVANTITSYSYLKMQAKALQFMKSIPPKYLKTADPAFSAVTSQIYCTLYLSLKYYEQARPYAEVLSRIVTVHPELIANKHNTYHTLVKYYTAVRSFSKAQKFLVTGIAAAKQDGQEVPYHLQAYYGLGFKLDSTRGDYRSAINDLLYRNKLKDSILNEAKTKQLKQLEVEFETEKKAREIKILNQKAIIREGALQRVNLIKNMTSGGILVLFVFLCLLYRQYLLKQKSNRLDQLNNIRINEKNKLLEHLLKEKEWLLKEVHHRVKNNLHTVICLLESQALYLENDALKAIEISQHRIYAMSLIHQKLYQSEDIKSIDMSVYFPEFVQYLSDSFGNQHRVRFQLDIESIQLGVSQAIPLALIVNEGVTNAIKYAFVEEAVGVISISLFQQGTVITLTIIDNGVGISDDLIDNASGSLGLKLMNGLSEDINAQIKIENSNGTRITVEFDIDPLMSLSGSLETLINVY